MWTDLLVNGKGVVGLYGGAAPSLKSIDILEITIHNDCLYFNVQWYDLPNPLPKRWREGGYDTCTCHFWMGSHEAAPSYHAIDLNLKEYKAMSMEIMPAESNRKRVILKDKYDNCFMDVEVEWIEMLNLGGFNSREASI